MVGCERRDCERHYALCVDHLYQGKTVHALCACVETSTMHATLINKPAVSVHCAAEDLHASPAREPARRSLLLLLFYAPVGETPISDACWLPDLCSLVCGVARTERSVICQRRPFCLPAARLAVISDSATCPFLANRVSAVWLIVFTIRRARQRGYALRGLRAEVPDELEQGLSEVVHGHGLADIARLDHARGRVIALCWLALSAGLPSAGLEAGCVTCAAGRSRRGRPSQAPRRPEPGPSRGASATRSIASSPAWKSSSSSSSPSSSSMRSAQASQDATICELRCAPLGFWRPDALTEELPRPPVTASAVARVLAPLLAALHPRWPEGRPAGQPALPPHIPVCRPPLPSLGGCAGVAPDGVAQASSAPGLWMKASSMPLVLRAQGMRFLKLSRSGGVTLPPAARSLLFPPQSAAREAGAGRGARTAVDLPSDASRMIRELLSASACAREVKVI